MLQRKNGATISEIMEKMGWQRHTVRGFMAGTMKKAGYEVESFKPEGGERAHLPHQYEVASGPSLIRPPGTAAAGFSASASGPIPPGTAFRTNVGLLWRDVGYS